MPCVRFLSLFVGLRLFRFLDSLSFDGKIASSEVVVPDVQSLQSFFLSNAVLVLFRRFGEGN